MTNALRRPMKSLGQNFLVDQNIINRIVESARIKPGDSVLEIGPGRGALTGELVQAAERLILIEFDHQLAAGHARRFADNERVTVIDADVLKIRMDEVLTKGERGWKVVANLPYNISTEVLFRLLTVHDRIDRMTLMLQKEVGDRLTAPPDCSEYGVTTVLLGLWFDIRREFIVSPGCFHPRPKVDSAVLSFTALPEARFEVGSEQVFKSVVKSSFSMRRKTLFNCLKSSEYAMRCDLVAILEQCGIDGRRRGETLSIGEYAGLALAVTRCLEKLQ